MSAQPALPGAVGATSRVRWPRRGALAVVAVLAAMLALAAAADTAAASFIVYQCGPSFQNLCRIAPDGSDPTPLTTDGQSPGGAYASPSLSRDGTRLAFVRGSGQLFTADAGTGGLVGPISRSALAAYLSPDGTSVADLENFGLGAPVAVCRFAASGADRECPASTGSAGWAPGNRLLISARESSDEPADTAICLLAAATTDCERFVAHDPARRLYDPAISPDGSTLAVTAVPVSAGDAATRGSIALFDYATGAVRGALTQGTDDATPAWSPDGTRVAFARGDAIYVASVDGPPGSERRLVTGRSPTWGGPADAPPTRSAGALRLDGLRRNPRTGTATLTVTVPSGGAVALSGTGVKPARRELGAAGRATLTIRATGARARILARRGRARVALAITFTPAGGSAATQTRRVTLVRRPRTRPGARR
jgi:hypothetical protein